MEPESDKGKWEGDEECGYEVALGLEEWGIGTAFYPSECFALSHRVRVAHSTRSTMATVISMAKL